MKRSSLTAISIVKLQEYYDHPRRNPFLAKGGEKKKKERNGTSSISFVSRNEKSVYVFVF